MNTEKQFIQAFNNGYVLEKHEPELLKTISKNLAPTNNYLQGFFAGKKQVEMENIKDQLFELEELRSQLRAREKDFGKKI